jgi:hypothetical protein
MAFGAIAAESDTAYPRATPMRTPTTAIWAEMPEELSTSARVGRCELLEQDACPPSPSDCGRMEQPWRFAMPEPQWP